eukprot:6627853-Pyramimonas_sp.AAC.1
MESHNTLLGTSRTARPCTWSNIGVSTDMNDPDGGGILRSRCFWKFPVELDGSRAHVFHAPPFSPALDPQWHNILKSLALILQLAYIVNNTVNICDPASRSAEVDTQALGPGGVRDLSCDSILETTSLPAMI